MKGGARPGAGRKRGSKDKKPRKGTEAKAEAAKLAALIEMGRKAKRRIHQEFLIRIANQNGQQVPLSLAEKKEFLRLSAELEAENRPAETAEKLDNVSDGIEAVEFLRQVWNDPSVEMSLRIRAAEVVHRGAGETKGSKGKKDLEKDRAAEAGKGRFAPAAAPLRMVK